MGAEVSLLLLDGFDDLSSWTNVNMGISASAGRYNGLRAVTATSSSSITFTIPPANESDTVTFGFAYYQATTITSSIAQIMSDNASNGPPRLQHPCHRRDRGATRDRGTIIGTSSAGLITINNWYFIEIQATLHDTTGSFEVRVNGNNVVSATAQDTKNAGTKTVFDAVRLQYTGTNTVYIDDCYIMAGAGDQFLGDIQVEVLYPNGNGTVNQWAGSDGNSTDNYLLVDDPTGTAANTVILDYVSSTTTGQQDLYQLTNLVRTQGIIAGVCHAAFLTKSDSASKPVKLVNRGAADTKSANLEPTMGVFSNVHYVLTVNPETGLPFTVAEVNALQAGIEVA